MGNRFWRAVRRLGSMVVAGSIVAAGAVTLTAPTAQAGVDLYRLPGYSGGVKWFYSCDDDANFKDNEFSSGYGLNDRVSSLRNYHGSGDLDLSEHSWYRGWDYTVDSPDSEDNLPWPFDNNATSLDWWFC